MRVLGFDVTRNGRDLAHMPTRSTGDRNGPDERARGADSHSWNDLYTTILAGGPDVNPELLGRAKYEAFWEMKQADGAVRSLSWMFKLPIRSAQWAHEPAKLDPDGPAIAKARAQFADWQFGLGDYHSPRLDLTWDEGIQQDLLFLDYGAQGAELIWGKPEVWVDKDGDEHFVRPLNRLAPRAASSVTDIRVDPLTGKVEKILQDLPNADWIPGDKLLWLVNEREGSNWWGLSVLRSAYGPWLIKKQLIVGAAIGYDRFMARIPWISHPPGDDYQQQAQKIGENLRNHERGYVTTAGDAEHGTGDWMIRLLEAGIADPTPFLGFLNEEISKAGLQQFTSLGTTQTGARAVGEVLSDPFYLALQSLAKQVAQARMRMVLRPLFDMNFGKDVPIPELTVSKIQGRNVSTLARALADLSTAGLTFEDRDTQNDIRDILDLQHLTPAAIAAVKKLPPEVGLTPTPGAVVPTEGGPVAGTLTGVNG